MRLGKAGMTQRTGRAIETMRMQQRGGDGYGSSGGVGERERAGSAVDQRRSDPLTGAVDAQRA